MRASRYLADVLLLTVLVSSLLFWFSTLVDYQLVLLIISFVVSVVLIDIGANTDGRIVIKIATGVFKLVDSITLNIIGLSKSEVTKVKANK